MPNLYMTMILCRGNLFPDKELTIAQLSKKLEATNICEALRPMPPEVQSVGKVSMKEGTYLERDMVRVSDEERAELVKNYGHDNWYDWALANWGAKWGANIMGVFECGGDCRPIAITMSSAWCAPHHMLPTIAMWLAKTFGFQYITFIGHNPYDCSVMILWEGRHDLEVAQDVIEVATKDAEANDG